MDHVRLDVDPEVEDAFYGASGSGSGGSRAIAVPIEAKLRSLSVRLLYEVCRVQSLSLHDLRIFDDAFIDYLFELVEQTRDMHDETFNYSVIKLIVALNEQFMVASLHPVTPLPTGKSTPPEADAKKPEGMNRVLRVLMSRIGSSMTQDGGGPVHAAARAQDPLSVFTTKGMSEYFYTNDLCVLVDVFLREIGNIDEDNESLRHTYLRVLHPLLTKTQLRTMPYKRPQIVRVLESLVEHEAIRDVDPTTKRLVARCLGGDWCVQFRSEPPATAPVASTAPASPRRTRGAGAAAHLDRQASLRGKPLKTSRSAENLNLLVASPAPKSACRLRSSTSTRTHTRTSTNTSHTGARPPRKLAAYERRQLVEPPVGRSRGARARAPHAPRERRRPRATRHGPRPGGRRRDVYCVVLVDLDRVDGRAWGAAEERAGAAEAAEPPAVPAGRMKGAALVALASTSQPNLTALASGARKAPVYQAAG
ncbi:Protein LDB17 [Grifola frondosa]|uniref:Protein LDB17 n=1 Tax=Grifola frondosa TaxID=5627 RepID=A0A1C7MJS0_GRIFR|nr:Protein LDB17 [Grifola frondosa]